MKHVLKYLFILHFFCQIVVQGQTNYEQIKSNGVIPPDFILSPSKKYDILFDSVSKNISNKERSLKLDFYKNSIYFNDFLVNSGKVCFNTELNKTINKIADHLLSNDPELRSQLTFYILKSVEENAFTLNNGVIFINIGLLANIETEAQLAFIISHEISHYEKKHVINGYIHDKKIIDGEDNYKRLNYDEKRISISKYSQQIEIIADSIGFDYFIKAGYNPKEAENALRYSLISNMSSATDSFTLDFLEKGILKLPNKYILENIRHIKDTKENSNLYSTHPEISTRIQLIKEHGGYSIDKSLKSFITCSEKEIYHLKEKSRFELVHLYLQNADFERTIHLCYLLKKDYPEDQSLNTAMGIALFQIASYKNNSDFQDIHHDFENESNSMHQIAYLFENLSPFETTLVATNYLWNLKKEYPQNEIITNLSNEIIRQLAFDYDREIRNIHDEICSGCDYVVAATDWLMKNALFQKIYNHYVLEKEKLQKEKEELINNKEKRKKIAKENEQIKKNGRALGIDTIVIVNPMCKIVQKGKVKFNWGVTEKSRDLLTNAILSNSQKTGLKLELLDIKS
ncbi:MAG: M48 family metallopeptidase, partial [Bacteroidales bacterium]|nr:M48 family metallopeptidase [Bacteroidales bacterium]